MSLAVPTCWTGEPGRDSAVHEQPAPRGPHAPGPRDGERMDRTQKRDFVAGLAQVFAETSMVVVTRYQGLTVAEATDLRRRMRTAGVTFKVTKNRLAVRALEGTSFQTIRPLLKG